MVLKVFQVVIEYYLSSLTYTLSLDLRNEKECASKLHTKKASIVSASVLQCPCDHYAQQRIIGGAIHE